MRRATAALVLLLPALGCSASAFTSTVLEPSSLVGVELVTDASASAVGAVRVVRTSATDRLLGGDGGFALTAADSATPLAKGTAPLVSAASAPSSLAGARYLAVTGEGALVPIGDDGAGLDLRGRYALEGERVLGVAQLGTRGVAFTLADGYAIARDGSVLRVDLTGARDAFLCHEQVFVAAGSNLYRLGDDGRPAFVTAFPGPLAGATCDGSDRVVAATETTLWRENSGALAPVVEGAKLANLVAVAAGVAFTQDGALCVLTDASLRCEDGTRRFARLFPSSTSYPFALTVDGAFGLLAARTMDAGLDAGPPPLADAGLDASSDAGVDAGRDGALDAGPSADERAWTTQVRPIAERACFGCHGTVGAASVSLTSYAAWVTNRNAIRQRVVTQQNMPPNGSSLASSDRAVLAAWLGTN